MKLTCGIDIGSRTIKIIFFDIYSKKIKYSDIRTTGINPKNTINEIFQKGMKCLNIEKDEILKIFTTGYGRKISEIKDKAISEISCHAKGVNFFFPEAKTIIDIGGQDSKGIIVNKDGKVLDFVMNDKCAAGTGRFLEKTATILETSVTDLSSLAFNKTKDIEITSVCVVFAESEIIGQIAKSETSENIVNAVHNSIAKRTKNLIAPLKWEKPVVFTGGVANNQAMCKALEIQLKTEISVVENPSITGALGAAIFASERI